MWWWIHQRTPITHVELIVNGMLISWRLIPTPMQTVQNERVVSSTVHVSMDDDEKRASARRAAATAQGLVFATWTEAAHAMYRLYPEHAARFIHDVQPLLQYEQRRTNEG